jgi:hypothetical protein
METRKIVDSKIRLHATRAPNDATVYIWGEHSADR